MSIPRKEYPRPQMVRDKWMNLNGEWDFEYDFGKSGVPRGMVSKEKYDMKIIVPFCPESKLSGIGNTDFLNAVWYRRKVDIPDEWKEGRLLLNFEAVDYYCEVWVNGEPVGSHRGGYTPFSFDITDYVKTGSFSVALYAEDDTRLGSQPSGKQSREYGSAGCYYTRITGIWQTVWMEFVPDAYIKSYKVTPDVDNSKVHISADVAGEGLFTAKIKYNGKEVGESSGKATWGTVNLEAALSELHLWQPLDAKLYDIELTYNEDIVTGYFGMRKIELTDTAFLINGESVFQRLILDQGFYPDGIYTASSDEDLIKDIEISMALGYNGARLHEKVFERRFIYHADKMGYLIWGEYANWGFDCGRDNGLEIYLPEWIEAVERDYNSPALIGWCPFNETWDDNGRRQRDELLRNIYMITKKLDKTRPVIDTSGNFHVVTDIYDIHSYQQDVEMFKKDFAAMAEGGEAFDNFPDRQKYGGQPYFVSEYGGIAWNPNSKDGWGYGNGPKTIEEFVERYCGLTKVLLDNPRIFALCYTQLYDVEQEINGIYYYDRSAKFTPEVIEKLRQAMIQKAAIEKAP